MPYHRHTQPKSRTHEGSVEVGRLDGDFHTVPHLAVRNLQNPQTSVESPHCQPTWGRAKKRNLSYLNASDIVKVVALCKRNSMNRLHCSLRRRTIQEPFGMCLARGSIRAEAQ